MPCNGQVAWGNLAIAGPVVDRSVATTISPDEWRQLFATFAAQTLGLIDAVEPTLLEFERRGDVQGIDQPALAGILRLFHSVEGGAACLHLDPVRDLSHHAQGLFETCRAGRTPVRSEHLGLVCRTTALLRRMLETTGHSGIRDPFRDEAQRLIEEYQRAMAVAAAAVSPGGEGRLAGVAAPTPVTGGGLGTGTGTGVSVSLPRSVRVEVGELERMTDLVGQLVRSAATVDELVGPLPVAGARGGDQVATGLARLTRELHALALTIRTVSLASIHPKLERVGREVAERQGKEVEVTLTGADTDLDRTHLETVTDALTRLVRNAVGYGIETPSERLAAGKPARALVRVAGRQVGREVVITVTDDGRLPDVAAIRARALAIGAFAPDLTELSPAAALRWLAEPGMVGSRPASEHLGRGVGLHAIRTAVETLGGRIETDVAGADTVTFTVRLPLPSAMIDGLLLQLGGGRYLLSTAAVVRVLPYDAGQVAADDRGGWTFPFEGRPIPLMHLGRLLGEVADPLVPTTGGDGSAGGGSGSPGPVAVGCESRRVRDDALPVPSGPMNGGPDRGWSGPGRGRPVVLVVEDAGQSVGLLVDEVVGRQQSVIERLGAAGENLAGVIGAAPLPDGGVGLVLDLPAVLRQVGQA